MQELTFKRVRDKVRRMRSLIKSSGEKIFAVTFLKRSDGSKRKMTCRLKVKNPSYVKAPSHVSYRRKEQDEENNVMTVYDCNCLKYSKSGKLNGRGGYKSVPLDGILRLKVNGEIYRII